MEKPPAILPMQPAAHRRKQHTQTNEGHPTLGANQAA
jgi:hypothetical protein